MLFFVAVLHPFSLLYSTVLYQCTIIIFVVGHPVLGWDIEATGRVLPQKPR